jgi:hypothetical protein
MKQTWALLLVATVVGLVVWLWIAYRRFTERSRAAEARVDNALKDVMVLAKPKPVETKPAAAKPTEVKPAQDLPGMAQQKLLYDAASKAGEAGEAVLSIQLYARLIARYPDSTLGTQARAAVEAQKKKLVVKS